MNEVTLMKAKVNPSAAKGIFILECVLCTPFVLCALFLGVWIGLVFIIGPIWTYYCYKKTKDVRLVITNKRIIAAGGMFGAETNIPIDSISAVSKGLLKSVSVKSSSGVVGFNFLENHMEVYNTINKLINTRTNSTDDIYSTPVARKEKTVKVVETEEPKVIVKSCSLNDETIDLLRKYKQLFDEDIITQEEFDEKKKQLLE